MRGSVLLVNQERLAWLTLLRRQFYQKRGKEKLTDGKKRNRPPEKETWEEGGNAGGGDGANYSIGIVPAPP